MQAMNEQLVDHEAGLLRLLTPPLQHSANNPGYIQAYPPGVRENGGQYSHAAVWAMMAQAATGDAEAAWESFQALSPAHRSEHPLRGPAYELEPYVMAGDIYGAPLMWAAAAGAGTPVRPPGCTARRWKTSWACKRAARRALAVAVCARALAVV
jgi:cellobiose phosphorylase